MLLLEEMVKVRRDAWDSMLPDHCSSSRKTDFTSRRIIIFFFLHDIIEFLGYFLRGCRFLEAALVTIGDSLGSLLYVSSLAERSISLCCFSPTSLFKRQSEACSSTLDCRRLPSRTRNRRTRGATRRSTRKCRNGCGISTLRTMRRYVSYWAEILCRGPFLKVHHIYTYTFLESAQYVWCCVSCLLAGVGDSFATAVYAFGRFGFWMGVVFLVYLVGVSDQGCSKCFSCKFHFVNPLKLNIIFTL